MRAVLIMMCARANVEELAHLDAGGGQLVPGGHDVGNDQVALGRTGRAAVVRVLPNWTEHQEPGGVTSSLHPSFL